MAKTTPKLIHEIKLPSHGVPYAEESGLREGKLVIRPITTAEEKMIYGSGTDQAIMKAFKLCVVEPADADLDQLTIPDKHFAIVAWRALSYGPDYVTGGRCRVCGQQHEYNINIQDLVDTTKELDESIFEPFPIVLPASEDKLELRFLRDRDIKEIERQVTVLRRKLKNVDADVDLSYPYRLASYIGTINGKSLPQHEKLKYIEGLIGRDSSYIAHKASKMNDYGIEPIIDVQCKSCQSDMRVGVPVDLTFFRSYFTD